MRIDIFSIIAIILLASCKEADDVNPDPKREFEDWIEITIPNGRDAYGIAGSISDTLLVTTWTKAYYSLDSGRNWQESKDFQGPVYDVIQSSDTVFALRYSGGIKDYNGPPLITDQTWASVCDHYTTDFGKTWERSKNGKFRDLASPIGIAESATGIVYKLKHDLNWLTSNSYTINFSNIEMYHNDKWQLIDFPLSYPLNNLYVDKNNYLYVSSTSTKYAEETTIETPYYTYPALIYIYKHQLP